ncbi:type II toxin-antitoxin system RelE/ParE family toxin [Paraliomyxa miuraensis]|uniref:type II toxin-antitoxin system RelE/ParE family toxin n=1 Tax=Paraliomyxa miuraensis TaxID=376150 RepID=UPI002255D9AF|nr:type II toxin-antitoxin system RelE/ParE family toxin [Paraliomyxa miuraensis]MCX4241569.1 type II toxin-antitoxin system RelE/ParE family toxin [Paraliomyxa miuraensis]
MTGPAVFHPEAADEFADAVAWYERQQLGLGDGFEDAVYGGVDRIVERPLAWPVWVGYAPARVFNLQRFPFRLVYTHGDGVLVIAVAHMKRRPGYWASRL